MGIQTDRADDETLNELRDGVAKAKERLAEGRMDKPTEPVEEVKPKRKKASTKTRRKVTK